MQVTVKFYAHLRNLIGKKMIEVALEEGSIVSNLLDKMILDLKIKEVLFDENDVLRPEITILKNGREIKFLKGLETKLSQDDEISVFPMVAGG